MTSSLGISSRYLCVYLCSHNKPVYCLQVTLLVTDINDNYPVFLHSPYLALVTENTSPVAPIMRVHAYDADSLPLNGLVRYFLKDNGASMASGSDLSPGQGDLFRVNATTGDIYLLRSLDREKQVEYMLTLQAMDSGEWWVLLS